MNTEPHNWNTRLEARRLEKGLSKSALARAVGVKTPTLNNWVDGKIKELMARNAAALCRALGVRLEWLLDGEAPMEAPAEQLLSLASPIDVRGTKVPPAAALSAALKTTSVASAAEIASIVKAALPARQSAMETTCRFIIAADLEALPEIVAVVKEIATDGTLARPVLNEEEMRLLQSYRLANQHERDGALSLLGAGLRAEESAKHGNG